MQGPAASPAAARQAAVLLQRTAQGFGTRLALTRPTNQDLTPSLPAQVSLYFMLYVALMRDSHAQLTARPWQAFRAVNAAFRLQVGALWQAGHRVPEGWQGVAGGWQATATVRSAEGILQAAASGGCC